MSPYIRPCVEISPTDLEKISPIFENGKKFAANFRKRHSKPLLRKFAHQSVFENGVIPAEFLEKHRNRRHLNTSQRAMVGAKMANMRQGARTDLQLLADWREVTKTEAAQLLNVGNRTCSDTLPLP